MTSATLTETHHQTRLKPPTPYAVVLLNDDYTPMDFVVDVLKLFFNKTEDEATVIMLEVHYKGKGVCGIYTKDIAATKVSQVNQYAREHEYPLMCTMQVM
ncbi:ATP-dependent Clp protease adapter ClpS [Pelistega sp. NLN82]|uniref:ATP-dependent Clp protease adapter protein ClpS n=1 Tax=Pelistega ratti TaxID=2652177 RepID=A0A6L9Y596_9BURK|nr:ATP-dependent Clp protease adapter ClpS [Pelistega ratti]NEN75436.1 ATP-dependent Clp protease adapter ClpS [Pelistega ratti]